MLDPLDFEFSLLSHIKPFLGHNIKDIVQAIWLLLNSACSGPFLFWVHILIKKSDCLSWCSSYKYENTNKTSDTGTIVIYYWIKPFCFMSVPNIHYILQSSASTQIEFHCQYRLTLVLFPVHLAHSRTLELFSFIDISSKERTVSHFLILGSWLQGQVGCQVVWAVK